MNYENVLLEAIRRIDGFAERYKVALDEDLIDRESGIHTVFDFVFTPMLFEAIDTENTMATSTLFDFLKDMEECNDEKVSEIAEFTVLEQLCDNYDDEKIFKYLPGALIEAIRCIRRYIIGPMAE